jgi:hypothetical protein
MISEIKMEPMLNTISWQEYFTFLVTIIAVYYLVAYWLCFRGKNSRLQTTPGSFGNENLLKEQPLTLFDEQSNTQENLQPIAHACMDELNAFFENQKKSKAIKSELMIGLYTILQKYPSLRHSDYRESLTNVMATQCEAICSIHLSAEELKGVWWG